MELSVQERVKKFISKRRLPLACSERGFNYCNAYVDSVSPSLHSCVHKSIFYHLEIKNCYNTKMAHMVHIIYYQLLSICVPVLACMRVCVCEYICIKTSIHAKKKNYEREKEVKCIRVNKRMLAYHSFTMTNLTYIMRIYIEFNLTPPLHENSKVLIRIILYNFHKRLIFLHVPNFFLFLYA